ncbi:MAG: carboxypeptidase-like regulatory domain-containing protein, partial [Bacteroidota bacterium]
MRLRYFSQFLILALFLSPFLLVAQSSRSISGQVLEADQTTPIPFANVILFDAKTQSQAAGTTTDGQGKFRLETTLDSFYLEISFIGFESLVIREFPASQNAQLGPLSLAEKAVSLDEVVIEGEVSQTEFKLDKRIFHVGKDLSSTGASAYDVLNNVPSVNVSIEGAISLRGSSGVQILINGKPSVIASEEGNALGTITADMIERVEVITNPFGFVFGGGIGDHFDALNHVGS